VASWALPRRPVVFPGVIPNGTVWQPRRANIPAYKIKRALINVFPDRKRFLKMGMQLLGVRINSVLVSFNLFFY
jgi:hypothetical protein